MFFKKNTDPRAVFFGGRDATRVMRSQALVWRSGTADIESAFADILENVDKVHDDGGRGGIRTPGARKDTPVFKTGAINRSATLPIIKEPPVFRVMRRYAPQTRLVALCRLYKGVADRRDYGIGAYLERIKNGHLKFREMSG